jgi:hypothetical protein
MTLAAPAFLAALGLLAPIVFVFLVRRRRQVVRVPSTMVWRLGARSIAKNRRFRNLRQLLALLACLLGVTALVLAATRPSGCRTETTVYVVDVSASMTAGSIDEARRWLTRDVAGMAPSARIALVLAGAEASVRLPPSPPGPRVDDAIRALAAGGETGSMDGAIALAEGLARSASARIVVLSDHPVDFDRTRTRLVPEQRIFSPRGSRDNVGIVGLYTRPAPDARDEEEREATVLVATSSNAPRRARLVVELAGRTLTERLVEISARGEISERVLLHGAGRLRARVAPADGRSDALAIDDDAWLDEVARQPPRVALVRGADQSTTSFFLAKAIRAAGITDLVEVNADGPAPADAEVAVVLREGTGRPAGVPVFLFGVEPKETGLSAHVVDKTQTHLRTQASEDPIMRGVAFDDLTALSAKVAAPVFGARTLVDLDAGPALIAGGSGRDSWVWLGIDPEASDLVLRVGFPVLVSNVLAHLGGASQVVTAATVPRAEVMLETADVAAPLPSASDPRWKLPAAPAVTLATLGALLLALEAWLTFRKRWAS